VCEDFWTNNQFSIARLLALKSNEFSAFIMVSMKMNRGEVMIAGKYAAHHSDKTVSNPTSMLM